MLNIQNPIEARKIIRKNEYKDHTAGTASKYVQGNLCIYCPANMQWILHHFVKKILNHVL